jgi:hypothetical protein
VWGVLDCARDPRIYRALLESRLEFRCLYSGKLDRLLEMNAPHLVELFPTNRLIHTWIDEGWGQSWGIFIRIADSSNLRHHLRKFLKVRDPQGRMLLFRYYDPRVLGVYLRSCNDVELLQFSGPIHSWCAETENGALLEWKCETHTNIDLILGNSLPAAIRLEQWQIFQQAAAERSVKWLAAMLGRIYSEHERAVCADVWLGRIRTGMARAAALGFSSRGDQLRYLALDCEYGAGFLEKPNFKWMNEILVDSRVPQPAQRMHRLLRAIEARAARAEEKVATLAEYLATPAEED